MLVLLEMCLLSQTLAEGLSWSYSLLRESGKFCPERDSCSSSTTSRQSSSARERERLRGRDRANRGALNLDWSSRNCFCDQQCKRYGDCCIDAEEFDPQSQRENYRSFSCLHLRQYGSLYMAASCPPDSNSSSLVTSKCEAQPQESDPFGRMPVTSLVSGVTYSNVYCAVCHGERIHQELRFWQPRLECPTLQGYQQRFKNLSGNWLESHLVFSNEKNSWSVEVGTIEGVDIPVRHDCFFDPFLPPGLEEVVRACSEDEELSKVEAECPLKEEESQELEQGQELASEEGEQGQELAQKEELAELCASYTALVYSEDRVFRNPHCALCNNVTTDQLICIKLEARRLGFMDHFKPVSFAVLFDIQGGSGSVGLGGSCAEGELWDQFHHTCRNVFCGDTEEQVYVEGSCFKKGEEPTTITSTTTTTSTTSTTTLSMITSSDSSSIKMSSTLSSTFITEETFASSSSVKPTTRIRKNSSSIVFPSESSSRFPVTSSDSFSDSFPVSSFNVGFPVITTSTRKPTTTFTLVPNKVSSSLPHFPKTPGPSLLSVCPKFQLSWPEFSFFPNQSVSIPGYSLLLEPSGYHRHSSTSIIICKPDSIQGSSGSKFSPVMGYVTLACLGVSLLCLLLHLLVTTLAPELQNLMGKNLACLSLSLCGAYSSFLGQMWAPSQPLPCLVLAAAMYYFYLATFCWMLCIACDVGRSLRQASTQLRLSSGHQWPKFIAYSLFGWLTPALLTAATLCIDLLDLPQVPQHFKPGLGASQLGLCWFSKRLSLVIYFIVPFSLIITLNILFFLSSSCVIWENNRCPAKITTSGPKTNFHLYLKLGVLMGLTWVAGLVAGGLDQEWVWYVFLVLNSLQGLFILCMFTCSKKVVRSLRERLCVCSPGTKEPLSSRESQESHLSSASTSQLTRPGHSRANSGQGLKYSPSCYEQYHQYDQRFYS